MDLAGKRVLVTGVITKDSIAFATAEQLQRCGRGDRADRLRPCETADGARGARGCRERRRCWSSTSTSRRTTAPLVDQLRSGGAGSTASCTRSRTRPRTRSAATSSTRRAETSPTAFQTSAVSLKELGAALLPLMRPRRLDRRARLRRDGRLADLRLDGRREGGAGVDRALPGARPRPARDPREPRLRRPAARPSPPAASRASSGSPTRGPRRRRSAGTSPTRCPSRDDLLPAVRLVPRDHRRDRPRRRRLPRDGDGAERSERALYATVRHARISCKHQVTLPVERLERSMA